MASPRASSVLYGRAARLLSVAVCCLLSPLAAAQEVPEAAPPSVELDDGSAVETPAVETPAVETPAVEAPAVEAPSAEEPSAGTVVTASRGRAVGTSAVAATTLTPREVTASPSRSAEDVLRSVPSVLLPRTDGRALHPTGQSMTLRGLGRGRSLILLDGLPLNDPFGGWIQWNKVAKSQLSRVEVVRGATSSLYGSLAMGGVVQMFTRPPEQESLFLEGDFGSADSLHGAASGSLRLNDSLAVSASMDAYASNGEQTISRAMRGAVDVPSRYESQNLATRAQWKDGGLTLWAAGNYFREERSGGTRMTDNRQWIADAAVGGVLENDLGDWEGTLYAGDQRFHNRNSRVDATRSSEVLALRQEIPVTSAGGSLVWSQTFGAHQLVAGVDARWVEATNAEEVFNTSGVSTGNRSAGGQQAVGGLFAEWAVQPLEALTLSAGVRADGWNNYAGTSVSLDGERTTLATKSDGALSPRVTGIYRLLPQLAIRSAAYAGFRAPNLNELYRGYFAGRVMVIPNPSLGAERLYGAELGVDWTTPIGLRLGATVYGTLSQDRIEQVTLDANTRQRQNIAGSQAVGGELEASWRPHPTLRLSAGYTLTLASISDFPQVPELVGKPLPNLPVHAAAGTVAWSDPRWVDLTVRLRAESAQYADDRAGFRLPSFGLVDVSLSRRLREQVEVYLSASNLLDTEVLTDRNASLERVGAPRSLWGGFRVRY